MRFRVGELPWFLIGLLAERRIVEGCDVRVSGPAAQTEEVFCRVGNSLRLIREHGSRFYCRLLRDLKMILITDTSGGVYLEGLRACQIGMSSVRRWDPLDLAMTIIHEATHARLSQAGFRYSGQCKERLERVCVNAEIAFAGRIPGSGPAIERTRALLETRWWTSENSIERALQELRSRGVPEWGIKLIRFVRSLRKRRQRNIS